MGNANASQTDISKYSKYDELHPPPPSDESLSPTNSFKDLDMSSLGALGDGPTTDNPEEIEKTKISSNNKNKIARKLLSYDKLDENVITPSVSCDSSISSNSSVDTIMYSDNESDIHTSFSTHSTQTVQYYYNENLYDEQVNLDTQTHSSEITPDLFKSEMIKNSLSQAFTNVFSNEAEKIGCLADQVIKNLNETTCNKQLLIEIIQKNNDLELYIEKLLELLNERNNLCTNLEKQNSALTHQNKSMKDIINITKDLLNIRNTEVQNIHEDLKSMGKTMNDEKLKHNTSLEKLEEAVRLNEGIKIKYLKQMELFQNFQAISSDKILDLSDINSQYIEYVKMKDLNFTGGKSMVETILGQID